ncbi:hypothetical protein [Photobacterium leiognathi]|uniref:hypothetical protein n=1 Tax=Photobacterium leiognathi TaxID=553611 RepID=UPI0029815ADD|nr:hypothetical protein [Photobacterium leiognathi]
MTRIYKTQSKMEQFTVKYATKNQVIDSLLKTFTQSGIDIKKRSFFRVLFSEMNGDGVCQIKPQKLASYCQLSLTVMRQYRNFFVQTGLISFYRKEAHGSRQSYDVYHLESDRLIEYGVYELHEALQNEIMTKDTISLPNRLFKLN